MIPCFRNVSCCIQGALATTTVSVPSRKLTGCALLATPLPTTVSHTCQMRPSRSLPSSGCPAKMPSRRFATASGRGIFPRRSVIFVGIAVQSAADDLSRHCAGQGQGDHVPTYPQLDAQVDDDGYGDVYIEKPA